MQLLGLDVSPRRVVAVVTDGDGRVLRRATVAGEPRAAISAALAKLGPADGYSRAGIAADVDGTVVIDELPINVRRSAPGAAAIAGEVWAGAARGAKHAICLWVGDRVMAGILLNGQVWSGAHQMAGSAAWLALNPVERQDYRAYGSLAAEVSERGIARRLSWRIQAGDHSAVLEKAGDLDAITALHVFDGARAGDGVAIAVVRDTARYLGMAVANLVTSIDPEIIVLGGPIAGAGDLLLEPVRQEVGRRVPPALASQLRVEISPLGEDGIAIGAAALARASKS